MYLGVLTPGREIPMFGVAIPHTLYQRFTLPGCARQFRARRFRMKRSIVWMTLLGLAFSAVAGRAGAQASPIATSMGDLRWGLSESEVISYAHRTKAAVDKKVVNFESKGSKWDHSPIAGEFTYGNNESMVASRTKDADVYYFFSDGKLWKIVKVLKKAKGDFKKFSAQVESKFGKGRVKKGEVTPGQGHTQWLEYLDRNSRMRAVDNSSKRGGFALIYEEMATVRALASTRPKPPSRLGGLDEDDNNAPKNELRANNAPSGGDGELAKASTKRSVFGHEQHQETDADYQARKQKSLAAQKAIHDRKEDAKKGEVLKQLDGINDSDPLGGL
jgi:hypothetical protein